MARQVGLVDVGGWAGVENWRGRWEGECCEEKDFVDCSGAGNRVSKAVDSKSNRGQVGRSASNDNQVMERGMAGHTVV